VTAHVIGASEFEAFTSTAPYAYDAINNHFVKSTGGSTLAWVRLPAGALVASVELEGCDTEQFDEITFVLRRMPSPGGFAQEVTPVGATGNVPGCGFFSVPPLPAASPLAIDNDNNTYFLEVTTGAGTGFTAVRVNYTLQVSPAPAVASFSDVPTSHPFFRFIEALVRSGITSGCGGGNFCPDAPLTRGQMAVFLSLGLGLHFAP
jgi:hypothetical protein